LRLPDRLRQELTPLLREIVPAPTDPAQTARALEAFFQQHFEYSLETDLLTDGGGHHPLTVLIRQRRPAWCVYFASAHAALLRCAGIPARVVGGYLVPEGGPLTGHVVVREQDAHAWVEAWIETEQRWRTFDPTPAGSRVEALGPLEPLGWMNRLGRELQSLARRVALKLRNHPVKTLGQLIGLPALLVLIPLAAWRWRVRRQQTRGTHPSELALSTSDRVLQRARIEFLRSLYRWGIQPNLYQTDADLLQLLAERPDAPHSRALEFVTHYQRARYLNLAGDDELLKLARF
jgi:transglutaminase-like putative cysteine protease